MTKPLDISSFDVLPSDSQVYQMIHKNVPDVGKKPTLKPVEPIPKPVKAIDDNEATDENSAVALGVSVKSLVDDDELSEIVVEKPKPIPKDETKNENNDVPKDNNSVAKTIDEEKDDLADKDIINDENFNDSIVFSKDHINFDNSKQVGINAFPAEILDFYKKHLLYLADSNEALTIVINKAGRNKILQAVCVAMSVGGLETDNEDINAMARLLANNTLGFSKIIDEVTKLDSKLKFSNQYILGVINELKSISDTVLSNNLLTSYLLADYTNNIPPDQMYTDNNNLRLDHSNSLAISKTAFEMAKKQKQIHKEQMGRSNRGKRMHN